MSFYINLNYPSSKSRCYDVSLLTRIGRPCWDNIISQLVRQWKGLDKIPSQNTNQNTVSDTPTLIKRSCAVVLINKRISNCVHETKAVEETKIDERNITENRARWKKTKTKKKKRNEKYHQENIDLKYIILSIFEGETELKKRMQWIHSLQYFYQSFSIKKWLWFFYNRRGFILNTKRRVSIVIRGIAECECLQ